MRWGFVVYHMCKIPLSKEQFLRAVISSFQMQADKICLKKRNKVSVKNLVKGDVLAGKILVNL